MHCIFDLDHTLIDSSHRQVTMPDGSLDLDHWRENSTPEMIAKDALLPMAKMYRTLHYRGHCMVICTARVMTDPDYLYLMEHDLPFHHMLSRPSGCRMSDHELKDILLRLLAQDKDLSWADFSADCLMFEDNQKVIRLMQSIGIRCIDAVAMNAKAAA